MSPGSPSAAAPRLLYRSTRLLHAAFLRLHQQQQREDVFCDVMLRAEGEAVAAHCCVLSVCSPFFMEQLARELPPQGRRVVLELQGLKIGALRKLVRFLYTAELEASSEEAQEVLAAARQLRVAELESLQLQGGCLVHPGPRWRLNRSCLRAPQPGSPGLCPTAGGGAEPGRAGSPPKGAPCPRPPLGRLKLRKVEGGKQWEVVQEGQPREGPAVGAGGVGLAHRRGIAPEHPSALAGGGREGRGGVTDPGPIPIVTPAQPNPSPTVPLPALCWPQPGPTLGPAPSALPAPFQPRSPAPSRYRAGTCSWPHLIPAPSRPRSRPHPGPGPGPTTSRVPLGPARPPPERAASCRGAPCGERGGSAGREGAGRADPTTTNKRGGNSAALRTRRAEPGSALRPHPPAGRAMVPPGAGNSGAGTTNQGASPWRRPRPQPQTPPTIHEAPPT
uniref:BTB domain-containing protein n=1 Tax=Anas zonorhyncha TaxID=75864 RepID=A0A8B9VIL8_9AVES